MRTHRKSLKLIPWGSLFMLFLMLGLLCSDNYGYAQEPTRTPRFGVYYDLQYQQRHSAFDNATQRKKDSIQSVKYSNIIDEPTTNDISNHSQTETRPDKSSSSNEPSLMELNNRLEFQKKKNKRETMIIMTAGSFLEDAARYEKNSFITACIGGVLAGLIYGCTIPLGIQNGNPEAVVGGSVAGSLVAVAAGGISLTFHFKSIRSIRYAGKELNGRMYVSEHNFQ